MVPLLRQEQRRQTNAGECVVNRIVYILKTAMFLLQGTIEDTLWYHAMTDAGIRNKIKKMFTW
jgi:hypothetical protein